MTDNTMVKRKTSKEQTMIYNDRQHNGQRFDLIPLTIVLSVIVNHCLFFWSYSFHHCVVCHCKSLFFLLIIFFWPLCCLSYQKNKQWFTMTDNTMVKRIRWKEQTMIYIDRQHNGQKNKIKRTNNDVNHCLFFWSYSFDHCVVYHCKSLFVLLILFLSPLYCLSL
jgi:hypothetical protein